MTSLCPRCASSVVPGQEYCLGCGSRLPGRGAVGGPRELGQTWLLRAGVALAVAFAGAALAVAAGGGRSGSPELVTATGGFATLPAGTLPDAPPAGPGGMVEWPPGDEGWTVVLASIPQTEGRRAATAKARAARRKGLATVGVLDSSGYASLHPGYWVVFSGIYASEAEATSALEQARRVARTASVRRIVP